MNSDQALELFAGLLEITVFVAGPILIASLIAGVFVGIAQAATQVNEVSVTFVVKVTVVIGLLMAIGPALALRTIGYARDTWLSVEHVVH